MVNMAKLFCDWTTEVFEPRPDNDRLHTESKSQQTEQVRYINGRPGHFMISWSLESLNEGQFTLHYVKEKETVVYFVPFLEVWVDSVN